MSFETVIGLEVHVQLATRTKLFSPAPSQSGGEPNTRVATVDLGLPGVLPVFNEAALRHGIRAALALEGTVNRLSRFDRKNYFYPDLPKGYQISQYQQPFCTGGRVPIRDGRYGYLERIHFEEDAGKNIHTERGSLVDLNRAGVALIEIVGRPDIHSPVDAHAYLENLKQILQYAGVSDCDMEKGSLRCDANISLRPSGAGELGTKVEIKNLNSFKMVQRALEYEERRQAAALATGGQVLQETRMWNDEKGETAALRGKESAHDYRYFPEPDLPPIEIPESLLEELRASMPELPAVRRQRFGDRYRLPDYDIGVLLSDRLIGDYFEEVASALGDPKTASNWVMTEVQRALNERQISMVDFPVPAAALAGLIRAQEAGAVNRQAARKVFDRMLETGEECDTAIAELGLEQINDVAAIEAICHRVINANPKPVADYRSGVGKALHALVGRVMRETRGRADPSVVEQVLRGLISG